MFEYVTTSGKEILKTINNEKFSELKTLYCFQSGNFQMNKSFMLSHIELIEEFISIHNDYFLVYQHLDEYEGEDWFLTNFIE